MTRILACLTVLLLAGCASRGAVERPDPEFILYSYDFNGQIGGTSVNGRVHFDDIDEHRIRYRLTSDQGHCMGELRRMSMYIVTVRCDALSIQLGRSGRFHTYAPATLVITQPVQRRVCVSHGTRANGQRYCAQWQTVFEDRKVPQRGTLLIERNDPTG